MTGKKILAIEAMALGVKTMADHAESLGYHLELLAEDPSIYVDKADSDVKQFATKDKAKLTQYIASQRDDIAGVFSSTDTWGVMAAELREEFAYPSRISSRKLSNMRDKSWVNDKLQIGSSQQDHSFPLITKPKNGTGSTDIHLLEMEADLKQFEKERTNFADYIIQPYYCGPIYSAEVWSDGKNFVFFGVTNRIMTTPPQFLERVKSFPHCAGTPWEADVKDWAQSIIDTLEYDLGLAHIEFIETKQGYQLVEINARMAGALITPAIHHCTNYNPYVFAIADALNIAPSVPDERIITAGHSHVSLYADHLGTLETIDGVETIKNFPGNATWLESKELGAEITELGTYKSRIGNVFAHGPSAEIAQDRALAAVSAIKVNIA